MSERIVVSEGFLSSWLLWPRESVAPEVLDEAASWVASSVVCSCSAALVAAMRPLDRRGLVVLGGELVRGALGRALPIGPGRRVAVLVSLCVLPRGRCGSPGVVHLEIVS